MKKKYQSGLVSVASAIIIGMGAAGAQAQAIFDVGGSGTIGDTTLTNSSGTAVVPAGGVYWTADGSGGGDGTIRYARLDSPTLTVQNAGDVTLTFEHRYNFEDDWDGGTVYMSVDDGASWTNVTVFTTNGYDKVLASSGMDGPFPDLVAAFTGQSTNYETSVQITSIANLGTFATNDTIVIQFRGGWDWYSSEPAPNWEIGTVKVTDSSAAVMLDIDFLDGQSGFTGDSDVGLEGPWTYPKPISRFEIDADALTADRYAPDVAGSVIDLNDAVVEVVLLSGTLVPSDTFTLFDLSGGTTITGAVESIGLPTGVWDTSSLGVNGTITYMSSATETLHNGDTAGDYSDTWNQASNWDSGIPSGAINATVASNITARCQYTNTPAYSGTLTLQAGAKLIAAADLRQGSGFASSTNSISASSIIMNAGSVLSIAFYQISNIYLPPMILNGDATVSPAANWADHCSRHFDGEISGTGQLTLTGRNNMTYYLSVSNSFSGGLIAGGLSNWRVDADATGCLGPGDVTIGDTITLRVNAADAINDSGTLYLVGAGDAKLPSPYYKLYMNAADTNDMLVVDGFPQPAGTYGKVGSGADYEKTWITGNSLLTVSSEPADGTAPTVTISSEQGGVTPFVGLPLTYTITFSEPHTPALTTNDLENSSATPIDIVSFVPEAGGLTVMSYTVVVKATVPGTLNLQIKSGASIEDLFGNALVVPVADTETLTVAAAPLIKGELGVWKPVANGGINPATGSPWAVGDTYRLIFVSSESNVRTADDTDVTVYDAYLQGLATASTSYPDLGNGTWHVLGSTLTTNAIDHTGTNPSVDGAGVGIFLCDGFTKVADNNADLWNGIDNPVTVDENGVDGYTYGAVATGSFASGLVQTDRPLGSTGNVTYGRCTERGSYWIRVYSGNAANAYPYYSISEPLTLQSSAPAATLIMLK